MIYNEEKLRKFALSAASADPAHDISHIERVVKNAKKYALQEKANPDIAIPAAWLHDCVTVAKDSDLRAKASGLAATKAGEFLSSINYTPKLVSSICHAIEAHSYSANIEATTLEAEVVQDADRIDALGAIGISRCLLVGGSLNRRLYCSDDPFCDGRTADDSEFCIDHFYTKLFSIADTLKTNSAKQEAKQRVAFMKLYLNELNIEVRS